MTKPLILCFSGADPCGGAGTQADIESISSMGGHAMTLTTALTVQNSQGVEHFQAVDLTLLKDQADCLLKDSNISAIKTGMLANEDIIQLVKTISHQHPSVPLIVDPVLSSSYGHTLSESPLAKVLREQLLSVATIATPNLPELRQLVPETNDTSEACKILAELGCEYVLVTGTHDDSEEVINRLYQNGELIDQQSWPRLPADYHGSGCTLAAALSTLLAQNTDMLPAVRKAQDYTWQSLNAGQQLGQGQVFPDRFYWRTSSNNND